MTQTQRKKSRIGMAGYASVYAALTLFGDVTIAQVSELAGIARSTSIRLVKDLVASGLAEQVGVMPGRGGAHTYKACRSAYRDQSRRVGVEMIAFAVLIRSLDEPMTVAEMCERSGCFRRTVRRLIDALHDHRLVHIVSWDSRHASGGASVPAYQFGIRKANAKKPKPLSRQQINARYRAAEKSRRLDSAMRMAFSHQQVASALTT